jgi:hypothetical protein
MIEEIKAIIDGQKIGYSMNSNEELIVSTIFAKEMSDDKVAKHIENYIAKGKISKESILAAANKMVRKANRTRHSFDSFDAMNKFRANNDCGDFWDDGEKWHVYKY